MKHGSPSGGAIHDFIGWPEELRRALWAKWSWDMDPAPDDEEKLFDEADQEKTWLSFARAYDGPRVRAWGQSFTKRARAALGRPHAQAAARRSSRRWCRPRSRCRTRA